MTELDQRWLDAVCAECDPIFDAAGVGFRRQVQQKDPSGRPVSSVLWEADPEKFAARYPDSGIVDSYGEEQWSDVLCIGYWVYIDPPERIARISVEGWNFPEVLLPLRGDSLDAAHLADLFARILAVPSTRLTRGRPLLPLGVRVTSELMFDAQPACLTGRR